MDVYRCKWCGCYTKDITEFVRCPSCLIPASWETIESNDIRYIDANRMHKNKLRQEKAYHDIYLNSMTRKEPIKVSIRESL